MENASPSKDYTDIFQEDDDIEGAKDQANEEDDDDTTKEDSLKQQIAVQEAKLKELSVKAACEKVQADAEEERSNYEAVVEAARKFLKNPNAHDDGTLTQMKAIIDENVTWNDKWSSRLDQSLALVEGTVRSEKQAVKLALEKLHFKKYRILAAFNDDHDHLNEYANEYKDASTFTSLDIMQPDNSNDDFISSLLSTLDARDEELSAVIQERDSLSKELVTEQAKVRAQDRSRLDAAYHDHVRDFDDARVRGLHSELAKERARAIGLQKELNLKDPIYQDGVRMRRGQLERARQVRRQKIIIYVRGRPKKTYIMDRNKTAHHWNVDSLANMFALGELKSPVDERLLVIFNGVPLNALLPSIKFKEAVNLHGTMGASFCSWTAYTHDAVGEKRFKALFNDCLSIRDGAMQATDNDKNAAAEIIDTNGLMESKLEEMRVIMARFEKLELHELHGGKNCENDGKQHGN